MLFDVIFVVSTLSTVYKTLKRATLSVSIKSKSPCSTTSPVFSLKFVKNVHLVFLSLVLLTFSIFSDPRIVMSLSTD